MEKSVMVIHLSCLPWAYSRNTAVCDRLVLSAVGIAWTVVAYLPHTCPPWANEQRSCTGEDFFVSVPTTMSFWLAVWILLVGLSVWFGGRFPSTAIFLPCNNPTK